MKLTDFLKVSYQEKAPLYTCPTLDPFEEDRDVRTQTCTKQATETRRLCETLS